MSTLMHSWYLGRYWFLCSCLIIYFRNSNFYSWNYLKLILLPLNNRLQANWLIGRPIDFFVPTSWTNYEIEIGFFLLYDWPMSHHHFNLQVDSICRRWADGAHEQTAIYKFDTIRHKNIKSKKNKNIKDGSSWFSHLRI